MHQSLDCRYEWHEWDEWDATVEQFGAIDANMKYWKLFSLNITTKLSHYSIETTESVRQICSTTVSLQSLQ